MASFRNAMRGAVRRSLVLATVTALLIGAVGVSGPTVAASPWSTTVAGGALAALIAGLLAPTPWILAALLIAILTAVWLFVVGRMIRAGVWGEAAATGAGS